MLASKWIGPLLIAGPLAGTLLGCWEIPNSSPPAPAPLLEVAATASDTRCPAPDFSGFIDAFAESAAIQKRYTRIPLEYGHLDAKLIGTLEEDKAFRRRTVNSFEAIPSFDRKNGGRIFRSKRKRRERGLDVEIQSDNEGNPNNSVVVISLPDTGFHVDYRFVKTSNCWNLVGIDDRST